VRSTAEGHSHRKSPTLCVAQRFSSLPVLNLLLCFFFPVDTPPWALSTSAFAGFGWDAAGFSSQRQWSFAAVPVMPLKGRGVVYPSPAQTFPPPPPPRPFVSDRSCVRSNSPVRVQESRLRQCLSGDPGKRSSPHSSNNDIVGFGHELRSLVAFARLPDLACIIPTGRWLPERDLREQQSTCLVGRPSR
jgi:hypothetical protein